MNWEKVKKFFGGLALAYQEPGRSQEAYLAERRKREGGWLGQLAMAGVSGIASAYEQKKQKEKLRALRQEIEEQKKESLEAIDTSMSAAKAPIEQEVSMMEAQRVARDPFMEAGVQQGAISQISADRRKREMAAGGIGSGGQVAYGGAVAQGAGQMLMAKESMRLKKEGQLTQAIAQQSQGLANIELSGMQSRQDAMRSYGERISGVTQQIGSMENPWRSAVTGGISALMGQVGQTQQMAQKAVFAQPAAKPGGKTPAELFLEKSWWDQAFGE